MMVQKKSTKKYKICVVGAGHVGLVAAACFAELGFSVVCIDSDKKRIADQRCFIFYGITPIEFHKDTQKICNLS